MSFIMGRFWVVGGEYIDTDFTHTSEGSEEWIGPFEDYESAMEEWSKHAWRTVDDATTRYRIECIDKDEAPPCTD
jgi:hypothetical protein